MSQPPPLPGGNGVFGARLTKDAEKSSQGEKKERGDEEDDDVEVCFICASPVAHNSVAPCNHRTCHICSLRLRALYKTKACAHCRTEAMTVLFTDDGEKRYEEFDTQGFFMVEQSLGIAYEKEEIYQDTVLLLRYNCPDESCDAACMGWPDLHRHVRTVHQKQMCDLCTRNKKVFTHEHELFTREELKKHEKYGDDTPGAIDQSGFKGHPECGFCRQRFYGDDELYAHCRDRHERCHLCDRQNGGNNPQYYLNYDALEMHFNKDHYPCMDRECQEKKFVVFDSGMDLRAHQISAHPNGVTKDNRRVDLSDFDYRPQYQENQGRLGGRRGGRGRDPNAEPLPASSSGGHMSRAEIAHQRAMAIQSAQSVSNRTFGGQLSQPEPQAQTVRRPQQAQRTQSTQPDSTPAPPVQPVSSGPVEALTPAEQARRLRHAAVTERAANLLGNEQAKMTEFRERISAYRLGTISAPKLIDAFFSLFDTSSKELGKLVKELAEIFEIPAKKDNLLKAWNDWKAINEDYPSLPGSSGGNAPTTAAGVLGQGVGSSRVLKLKSSTAQSSRSAANRQTSWGSAAPNATPRMQASAAGPSNRANPSAFPSLPGGSSRNDNNGAPTPSSSSASTPSWLAVRPAAHSTNSSSAVSSSRPSPLPSRKPSSTGAPPRGDAFPALPPGKKPTSTVFSPGYSGSGVIRQNRSGAGTPVGAWGGGGGGGGGGHTPPAVEEGAGAAGGGGKKKGKRGQVLFQWG